MKVFLGLHWGFLFWETITLAQKTIKFAKWAIILPAFGVQARSSAISLVAWGDGAFQQRNPHALPLAGPAPRLSSRQRKLLLQQPGVRALLGRAGGL